MADKRAVDKQLAKARRRAYRSDGYLLALFAVKAQQLVQVNVGQPITVGGEETIGLNMAGDPTNAGACLGIHARIDQPDPPIHVFPGQKRHVAGRQIDLEIGPVVTEV